jgi:hypothetical protein
LLRFLQNTIFSHSWRERTLAKSLKQKNQPQLITFVVANVVLFGVLAFGLSQFVAMIDAVSKGNIAAIGKFIAVPAVLSLVTAILGWAMPRQGKEALVFWKIGKNCLPSSRAFTELGPRDPRVDMSRLATRLGPLPTSPTEQTAVWYRIYRGHGAEASVEDAHGAYLKFREMTNLALALLVGIVSVDCIFHVAHRPLYLSIFVLLIEYFLLMFAARNASLHFVVNVLALESSAPTEASPGQTFVGKFDHLS